MKYLKSIAQVATFGLTVGFTTKYGAEVGDSIGALVAFIGSALTSLYALGVKFPKIGGK